MIVRDEALEEDVFDAIKVFQSVYATRPDLLPPESEYNVVVDIIAEGPHSMLEAYLLPQWASGQAYPVALPAEVRVRPAGPNPLDGYHQHVYALELPTMTLRTSNSS
jgi:hypothetical protein